MLSKYSFWIILFITFVAHSPALKFSFWKDDWINIWGWMNRFSPAYQYWNHPGTAVEFAIFSQIFGATTIYWQVLGIVLRLVAALSVGKLLANLTNKRDVGLIASLFYAVGVAGVDAVGWTSAHVVHLDTIFMCLGLAWIIEYFRYGERRILIRGLVGLFLSFICDPWRMFPVFIIALVCWWWLDKQRRISNKLMLGILIGGAVIVGGAMALMWPSIMGSELFRYIGENIYSPFILIRKSYVVNNYVQSIMQLWFGWVVPFADDAGTGVYNGGIFRLGVVFIFAQTLTIIWLIRIRSLGGLSLAILWLIGLLMYVPNWLFEPRLTMASSHRYMAVSAVGLVGFVAYIMSYLPRRVWVAGAGLFILGNLVAVDRYYQDNLQYRSQKMTQEFLITVEGEVGSNSNRTVVYVLTGGGRMRTRHLGYADALPFALHDKINDPNGWPIVMDDLDKIREWLEGESVKKVLAGREYIHPQGLELSGVYGWEFRSDGQIVSISERIRKSFREKGY